MRIVTTLVPRTTALVPPAVRVQLATLLSQPGAPGVKGSVWYSGLGVPSDELGTAGDYYIATDTLCLYGPKTTVWGAHFACISGTVLAADIVAALENASAPSAGNPFATADDIDTRKFYHGIEKAGVPYVSGGNLIIPLASGEIIYWFAGMRYRTTAQISIPLGTLTADAQYYVAFTDALGTAAVQTSITGYDYTAVMIATVVWNGGTGYEVGYELHAYDHNVKWHRSAHLTYGTQYSSGGGIVSAASTFSIAPFTIFDEDIQHTPAANTTAARIYTRKNASSNVTFTDALSNYLYRYDGANGAPQYDDSDGTPANVSVGQYGVYWVYFTNDRSAPVAVVLGRGTYATQALAQAELKPALPNRSTAEWRLAYKMYYRNIGGTATYQSALTEDYRATSTGPSTAGGVTTLPASSVTFTPAGDLTSTNAQAAIEELDADKAPSSNGTISGQYDVLVPITPAENAMVTHSYLDGALSLDASAFTAGKTLTVTITNWPTTGVKVGALFVYLKTGANLPTMSYTGKGANVTAPTLTVSRLHRLVLSSIDAGTTVDVSQSGVY